MKLYLTCTAQAPVNSANGEPVTSLSFAADRDHAGNREWVPNGAFPSASLTFLVDGPADEYVTGHTYSLELTDATPELLREDAELTEASDKQRVSDPENDQAVAAVADQTGGEPVPFTEDGSIDGGQLAGDTETPQAGTSKTAKGKA